MSATALDDPSIFDAVQGLYDEVAAHPSKGFHFPTGPAACRYVGYPDEVIDALPDRALESFAGVGNPFLAEAIAPGDTVVDVGSGSGVDVLVAARTAGPSGTVYGIDMTEAMIEKAEASVRAADANHVHIHNGRADDLPLEDGSVDVVTSNGVFNLVPYKAAAFREAARVLKPGGVLQLADIVLSEPAGEAAKADPELWAECIVGAEPEAEYLDLIDSAGFEELAVLDHFDYFEKSPNESTRTAARDLGAHTIVLAARQH
jgi:SAM-dependent methyltransferase